MPDIVSPPLVLGLWAVLGFLAGSVPFGILIARALGLGDLRQIGSGNIGATNVLRTGHKGAAAATLLLDALKGLLIVVAARMLAGEDAAQVAAIAAYLGHCFPPWLGFRGGKGVATFFGVLAGLAWPVALGAATTWLAFAAVFRYSSLSALMAAGFAPIWALWLDEGQVFFLTLGLAALIYARHWGNIRRLRAGTEPRIGRR